MYDQCILSLATAATAQFGFGIIIQRFFFILIWNQLVQAGFAGPVVARAARPGTTQADEQRGEGAQERVV